MIVKPNCGLAFIVHSVLLFEAISTVIVSNVKPPHQTMVAISTESVMSFGICPPTTMSLLGGTTATKH